MFCTEQVRCNEAREVNVDDLEFHIVNCRTVYNVV